LRGTGSGGGVTGHGSNSNRTRQRWQAIFAVAGGKEERITRIARRWHGLHGAERQPTAPMGQSRRNWLICPSVTCVDRCCIRLGHVGV
jgi:hypothetical protein